MTLHIISPEATKTFTITWLDVHTPEGNLIIQPNHAPIILTLLPHKPIVFRLKTGKQESIIITKSGILEVTRTKITALIHETA